MSLRRIADGPVLPADRGKLASPVACPRSFTQDIKKKDTMADFAFIKDQDVWINLDYVVRMEPGADDEESTSVIFVDGSTFTIS